MRPIFALLLAVGVGKQAIADAPKIDRLFPLGGQRGESVDVRVSGTTGKSTKAWCSRKGLKVDFDGKSRKLKITIPPDAEPGVCWLRLFNQDGASAAKAFAIGTLPDIVEKEPNNELRQANELKTSSVVNGVLSKSGEVDTFAITVKKGQTLVASMQANQTFGSPMDGVLQIVSARGFVLEQNDDDHGFDPQVTYTAKKDETVYLRTFAFPATPNSSIRLSGGKEYIYRLTVTTGPFLDHPMPLAMTRSASSEFRLHGWNIPAKQSSVSVSPPEADDLTIHREPLANTGTVRVVPFASVLEREPNDAGQPQSIALPTVVSGYIDKERDVDVFEFTAKKGQRLRFVAEARALGSPLDPVLQLTDAKGALVERAETRSSTAIDETLSTTIKSDGTYRLEIRDLHRRGGWRYFYRLTMQAEPLLASLSAAADAFVLKAKKPLTIPLTYEGRLRLADDVKISVDGLPKTVTVKTGKLGRKRRSRTIEVVLTAKPGAAFNGPIRISARTKDGVTHATATVKETGRSIRDLWLTVTK